MALPITVGPRKKAMFAELNESAMADPSKKPAETHILKNETARDDEKAHDVSLDNYAKADKLGSGCYGTVFKYTRKEGVTNGPMAMAVKVRGKRWERGGDYDNWVIRHC